MKKLMTVTALIFAGALSGLLAQCPVGNVNLFTQADVHNFAMAFPDCQHLDGNLTLGKMSSDSDIHDLSELDKLSSITGSITLLGMPNLSSLNGLQSLQTIGGDLKVIQNAQLTSLEGLNGLTTIEGNFFLSFQDQMTSLQGLDNLETIGKDLSLSFTPSLLNLEGLQSLKTIHGSMILENNDFLISMEGLEGLEMIGVDLILRNNTTLVRLDGLDNLATIGRDLRIGWEYVDGYAGNPGLTDLDGLASLSSIGGKLGIIGNESLSLCAIEAVCEFLSIGGPSIIKENAPGCDTKEEVMEACGLTSTEEVIRENLRILPNPATDQITLHSPYPIQSVRIFDAMGQLILENHTAETRFDVSSYGKGLYLIRIRIENGEYVQRLVIQ